jgi:hypothetical protein
MLARRPGRPDVIGNRKARVIVDLDVELARRFRRSHPPAEAEGHLATTRRRRR